MKLTKRCSGVLMPISSLPSDYGIGTIGKAAYEFIDFLKASGQKYWQMLPIGPTGYGDSPYASFSTFAGNPYFIDLDMLIEEGLLEKTDLAGIDWGDDPEHVDYGKIYENRFKVLRLAYERGYKGLEEKIQDFRSANVWVENYGLYMSVKKKFGNKSWLDWTDESIRRRDPQAVRKYRMELEEDVNFYIFMQYIFYKQWDALRAYAKKQGIGFIGDVPIYVAMDSSDIWSEPQFFQLDDQYVPTAVSGVPPDIFTADGQLWGNPLYNWDKMQADGFGWWIRRIEGAQKLYDVIRIDHFRGFESYWAVPYGDKTARGGKWRKGPGMKLVGVLTSWINDLIYIAEDLGVITPAVRELLDDSGLPGMRVLQFAFDPEGDSSYMPHNIEKNSVCYVGTHDNDTLLGWYEKTAGRKEVAFAGQYLNIGPKADVTRAFLRAGMGSTSILFVAAMQDLLKLDGDARMNFPGKASGNWTWRMKKGAATEELAAELLEMTKLYRRYIKTEDKNMLPKDPVILLSYINTQLRDNYKSLEDLCEDKEADAEDITKKLESIGYRYNRDHNRFD